MRCAPDSLIDHWQKWRGVMALGTDESLPGLIADLDAMARGIAPEFAGKSALCHLHALLVAHPRKRRFPDVAPALFRRL